MTQTVQIFSNPEVSEITKQYKIPVHRLHNLEVKLFKLFTKAQKLGSMPIRYNVGEKTEYRDERGKTFTWYAVTVSGTIPRLNGWSFEASIQHAGEAGNIVRVVPGRTVSDQFRTADPNCDHCKSRRIRRNTFIVSHGAEGVKQVGRQCLADFMGHADPHCAASLAEIWTEIDELCDDSEGQSREEFRFDLKTYLACVVCAIRNFGWISKAQAMNSSSMVPSASTACQIFNQTEDTKEKLPEPIAQDLDEADRVLQWIEDALIPKTNKSDYEHNVSVISRLTSIDHKATGLAASMIVMYRKAVGRDIERRQRAAVSSHFGTVSKREEFTLTVSSIKEIGTDYGVTRIHIFLDVRGNEAVWFSSSRESLTIGSTYCIKGTVKVHNVYQGVNQTILTRCKVVSMVSNEEKTK